MLVARYIVDMFRGPSCKASTNIVPDSCWPELAHSGHPSRMPRSDRLTINGHSNGDHLAHCTGSASSIRRGWSCSMAIKLWFTNYAVCQLICGSSMPNGSISASTNLQQLIRQRNDAMHQNHRGLQGQKEELFPSEGYESSAAEPPSKQQMKLMPETHGGRCASPKLGPWPRSRMAFHS